ncbi:MAG: Trm112 family protein [Candidatus Sphingomonas phytovorans]|nr:Trm112 family protein [Sphingomonas sp.]WEK02592.1 MAG: Trm112 family protein [Sphingomonas sp.]
MRRNMDETLLARLVCPSTRTPLRHDAIAGELVSDQAGLAYPIRDGIPVLLIEAARRIDTD